MTMHTSAPLGAEPLPTKSTWLPRREEPRRALLGEIARLLAPRAMTMLSATASILALFAIWYLGTKYQIDCYVRFKNVPTPAAVLAQAASVCRSRKFLVNVGASVERILIGFVIATVFGVFLGLVVGKYRRVRELCMPAFELLRPIPAIAWVPMAIMLWPTTEASIVFITFVGAFFPILLNTIDAVHGIDQVFLNAGRSLGASELQLFRFVILPGVLPGVFTGLSVGMGVAWVSLIAAEMISGQFGVGYFTWEAYSLVNYPAIVLGMLTIGGLGLACSGLIRAAGRLVMPWHAFSKGRRR